MPVNTPEQEKAINFRGGNLYVSASAGSGKTYVMISRIISHILRGECEVNQILALTFTRAAAAEMKEKLRKAITEKIVGASADERAYLTRQLRLLPLTTVGTIHSFCTSLLKSYFFEAGVDPNFELLPEEESVAMKNEALSNVIELAYEKGETDFLSVATAFSSNRRDDALMETIFSVCGFAEAEKDGEAFFEKCMGAYTEQGFLEVETALFARLTSAEERLNNTVTALIKEGIAQGYNEKQIAYLNALLSFLSENQKQTDFYARVNALCAFVTGTKPSAKRNAESGEIEWSARFSALVKSFKDCQKTYQKITTRALAEKANGLAQKTVGVIVGLCKEYQEEYARLKAREGKLDYSDLERKTLAILQNPAICQAVKSRYRYVFVDEYQDVNGVQEEIFSLLTENNLFLVGDVKQSIYAFRGCNPELFNQKIKEGEALGGHVRLTKNFRSASGVIEGVNSLFRRIMTLETVGQDYTLEELSFGGGYPEKEGDVCFLDYEKEGKETLPLGVYSVKTAHEWTHYQESAESVAVCDLVEALVGKEEITVNAQEKRKITYGDIAILYRSKSVSLSVAEGLKRRDIPLSVEKKIPLTSSAEVSLLLSALRLATGSREDIPFVNVLLSPLGGMEESELKEIRLYQKKSEVADASFYHAALLSATREGAVTLFEGEIQA